MKKKNGRVDFIEGSKLCAAKWKHLPENEKEKYRKMSEEDAIRYKKQMENLSSEELKMTKRKKDPGAPLRPLSAYMWFCKRNWKKVAKANPGKGTSKVVQLLAQMWTSSTEDKKKIYEEYAECDKKFDDIEKEKYLKQKKAIKLKGGHF